MEILALFTSCLLKPAQKLCNQIWSYGDQIRELKNKAEILRDMIKASSPTSLEDGVLERSKAWCTEADDIAIKCRGRIWTHSSSCLETEGLPTTCCGKIWNPRTRYQLSKQIMECSRRFNDLRKELEYHVHLEETRIAQREQKAQLGNVRQPLGDQPIICYERQPVPEDIVGKGIGILLDDVIKELLNDDGKKWVGVCGTGGLGKTTLAKMVNNDSRVQDCFAKNIAWITVGKESDFKQVTKRLESKVSDLKLSFVDVDSVKIALENAIHGKHVLFILDDVWEVGNTLDLFDVIKNPSKVLVTTRNKHVIDAKHGKTLEAHFLTDEDSIKLFEKKAFGDELPQNNMVIQFAEKMARACHGLPLLIELTGNCMSQYKGYEEDIWENMMEDFQNRGSEHSEIKVVLKKMKLSFDELKHIGGPFDGVKIQECFLYMAAFQEDSTIHIDSLIKCWRGEDLVGRNAVHETMNILRCLESRSLLQIDDSNGFYQWIIKVHDVVRQLCIEICRERRCLFGPHDAEDTIAKEGCFSKGKKFEKVSRIGSDKRIPVGMHVTDVLLLDGNTSFENLDKHLLKRLTKLKVLSLQNTSIRVLPQSISKLKNLQTLDLKGTKLTKIPKSIFTMRQLRYLNITPAYGSSFYMDGFQIQSLENLSRLEDLTWRFDTEVSCIDFSSLASLHNLQALELYCRNSDCLLKFNKGLGMLKDLHILKLEGGRLDISSISESNLTNLRTCILKGILEGDWENLVRNSHRLNNLQVNNAAERVQETGGKDLTWLGSCKEIEVMCIPDISVDFFTLESLPKLKELKLTVTDHGGPGARSASFPCLEVLELVSEHTLHNDLFKAVEMSKLRKLRLSTAGGGTWKHLPRSVTSLGAGLKRLVIRGHVERLVPEDARAHDAWSSLGLDTLELWGSEEAYPDEFFEPGGSKNIKRLFVCPGRRWQHLPKSITKLTRLTHLQIGFFPHDELVNGENKMETLFGGGAEDDGLMSGLIELRTFVIVGWEGLIRLPRSVASRLPQLERIHLIQCPNLEELISADDDEKKESLFPKLKLLWLQNCGRIIIPVWLENRSQVTIHR